MSEYLYAEIHFTEDTVELRWEEADGRVYGLMMGHDMHDALERELPNQRTAVLTEALVFDADEDDSYYFSEDFKV